MTEGGITAIAADGSCLAAVEDFLGRAGRAEPTLRAFTEIRPDRLRADAHALDALPTPKRGPLHGILLAVKEVFDVAGYVCGWGTPIHAGRQPSQDAAMVAKLRAAGALVAGITVSTEYALSLAGPTTNPFDSTRTPGASSQGSAAAVGAGLVPAALGSQTIGSIIRPAAYCGCIGVKLSWGAIDAAGSMPLSDAIDHPGIIAADPDIAAAILKLLAPQLMTPPAIKLPNILVLEPWHEAETAPEALAAVERATRVLAEAGTSIQRMRMPDWIATKEERVLDTILAFGVAKHHGEDYVRSTAHMSDRLRDYVVRGRAVSQAAYDDAIDEQDRIRQTLDGVIGDGVAIMPPTTGIAPKLDAGTGSRAPQRLWTLAGLPAMTVPFGRHLGMPLGVQAVARHGQDARALAVIGALYGKG